MESAKCILSHGYVMSCGLKIPCLVEMLCMERSSLLLIIITKVVLHKWFERNSAEMWLLGWFLYHQFAYHVGIKHMLFIILCLKLKNKQLCDQSLCTEKVLMTEKSMGFSIQSAWAYHRAPNFCSIKILSGFLRDGSTLLPNMYFTE